MSEEETHRVNDDEQNPATLCGIDLLQNKAPLATVDESPSCDWCRSAERATEHIVTINFHIKTDVDPQAENGLETYLRGVGESIVDGIHKDWFGPTEEYLHITGATIEVLQGTSREELAQYLKAYVAHEIVTQQGSFRIMDYLAHWLEAGLEAFEAGAR